MCSIRIDLTETTPDGTNIVSAIGQYRLIGSATWINFTIILSHPSTPDITVLGSYELRVNVTNNVDDTSEWSNIETFKVSSNCGKLILLEPSESTVPYSKHEGHQKITYTSRVYTKPNWNIGLPSKFGTIQVVHSDTKIRLYINFSAKGKTAYNVTYDKTFTTTQEYATVKEWFEDQVESDSDFNSFINSYTREYGFSTNGLQFYVWSHRSGPSNTDGVNTNVSLEFGLS